MRTALAAAALLLAVPAAPAVAQQATLAAEGVRDYRKACRADGGRLWGRSLCGPVLLVDRATRRAVAGERPPASAGAFAERDGLFTGRAPDDVPLANTSFVWEGRPWVVALLPLPAGRADRTALLLHEAFHRVQDSLGLGGGDPLNAHLDEREGRSWLRLELRALRAALLAPTPAAARAAARDAMLFRAARHRRYPGADTLEAALELHEGLAEYTGARLSATTDARVAARVAAAVRDFEARPTYVRALGYGTGAALGLLLDRWAPGWRGRVRAAGLAPQLASALGFTPPRDSARLFRDAGARAARYDGAALAAEERTREEARARRAADHRARLRDGPVLVLRQRELMRMFDPNTLVPLGADGTVYPTGTFTAPWGRLEVTEGGALVADDFTLVRVQATADTAPRDTIRGPGWTLVPAAGWTLRPGPRAGDLELARGDEAAAEPADTLADRLARHVDGLAAADRFSGVVLLARNGAPVLRRAWGLADRERRRPNTPGTAFNLGSINKAFTAIAIRQLAAAGKLHLDSSLARAWPDYPNPEVARRVTIRQLLQHRSGLGGDVFAAPAGGTRHDLRHNRDHLPLFVREPLQFEPGTRQRYSNAGYVVLGMLVERLSGEDYYDYVRRHVYEPAGMTQTRYLAPDSLPADAAIGYTRGGRDAPAAAPLRANTAELPGLGSAAGGGYSTADDLLRYLLALRAGKIAEGGPSGIGIAGGSGGINAMIEGGLPGGYDLIVLTNLDPPSAEAVGETLRGWMGAAD